MIDNCRQITRLFFIALVLCLGLSSFAIAQDETSATVTGQVLDSTGAAVANATVVAKNSNTGLERRIQTNDEGNYSISALTPGEYSLTVEQTGFKKYLQVITLNAKDRRPIQITLEVGAPTETVTVTDQAPLLQDSPTGQTLVSGNQIVELPLNNRNFIKLLETVPGVSSDLDDESSFGLTSRASVSINGLRRNAVNYTVDGVSNTDVGSNITLLSTPTVDSIQEFKVLSSNYTAEVGRSGGGSVVIVTRGGGKNYSGTLYEFVRNDYFNANSFFNNRRGRDTNGNPLADTPKLRYNNFGGTFSGPVYLPNFGEGEPNGFLRKSNKTFFFFSEEARRITRGVTDAGSTTPTADERNGNFSADLGLPLCLTPTGTTTTTCSGANTPYNLLDTSGNSIQVRQNQVFRPTDKRPYAGNIIPVSDLDPRALGLSAAYPLPNTGVNGYTFTPISINNTRQETFRLDHVFTDNQRIFGRYTHDLSETQESQGLFGPYSSFPGISTSNTRVPGQVFTASYTGIFSKNLINEFAVSFSGNEIKSTLVGNGVRSNFANAGNIQQLSLPGFSENGTGAIPTIGTRFGTIGSFQGYSIKYGNLGFRDVLSYTTGNHIFKFGAEITKEYKDENTGGNTQGSFVFDPTQSGALTSTGTLQTGTGDSFASFLLGRANTYSETQTDFRVHQLFGRREFFAQDTWKVRPNLTIDLGVRYQYFVPPYDRDSKIGSFDPTLYDRSKVTCANAGCTSFVLATTDNLDGIGVAGSTSRFGRYIMKPDKNNFSPRVGLAYSPNFESGIGRMLFGEPAKSVIRAGYGFYYDQPLVGIFEVAAFSVPSFNQNLAFTSITPTATTAENTITFSNPGAGTTPGTRPNLTLNSISPDFKTPEIQVYSLGIQREIFRNAVIDISYVGTKGDFLIRTRNINFVTPADVVSVGTANLNIKRPYLGFGTISQAETSAISRYNGLLSSFNYRLSNGFTITLAYTFSKTLTDASNDRDGVDSPQNSFDFRREYAEARTSRPHIFSASYVYELPFFKKSGNALTRTFLSGYQIAGITNFESGAPVARVTVFSTLTTSRGLYPNQISDPNAGLAGTTDPATGLPFIFDPTAFAPAPAGQFGNSVRSFARLPGRKQTNLILSKKFYFDKESTKYIQLRAEAYNIFNTTQFTGIGTTLPTAGPLSNTVFGRPTSTRPPREFQFGAKLFF